MQKFPARRRAVAAILRQARLAAGLSQRALSFKLGEVNNYAHSVEGCRQSITAEDLIEWAKACDHKAWVLMRRIEARPGAR